MPLPIELYLAEARGFNHLGALMNKYKAISILLACLSFLLLCFLISGMGQNTFNISMLNPIEALGTVAFVFGFGFGIPLILSYLLALLIVLGIPFLVYLFFSRIIF